MSNDPHRLGRSEQELRKALSNFCQRKHQMCIPPQSDDDDIVLMDGIKELVQVRQQKDNAYWQRNQLVAALSKLFPAWLERHPESDTAWEDDWRNIVFIEIPTRIVWGDGRNHVPENMQYANKQLSWHIHDSELNYFSHLTMRSGNSWDGHTDEEKYNRLQHIKMTHMKG